MRKKTCFVIFIISAVVAVIGLLSFLGGLKPVNIGAFLFPAVVSISMFCMYKKK